MGARQNPVQTQRSTLTTNVFEALAPIPTMSNSDITQLSGRTVSEAIRTSQLSCVEVMQAYLGQIERMNPKVNAIVAMREPEQLLQQALACDDEIAKGHWHGPLHGLPQAPKDILPVAGLITSKGSPLYASTVSSIDAILFERMRQAGAIFVGRTNSPEFGLGGHTDNPVYGVTKNAFDLRKSAGGSSGGAAVAVALRMLPVADGSDMMGSLRTPAAFNNIYGLRPTLGMVPHGPTDDVFFQQLSVSGPMARNVPDLAWLYNVMAGQDGRLPLTRKSSPIAWEAWAEPPSRPPTIGWLGDLSGQIPTDPEVLQVCQRALGHFETFGCNICDLKLDVDFEKLWNAWSDLRSFSIAGPNLHLYRDPVTRRKLSAHAIWEIERGMRLSGMDVYEATKTRSAWYQTLRQLHQVYDFLVLPATQTTPFDIVQGTPQLIAGTPMKEYHRWIAVSIVSSMSGLPALSAPAGFSATGMPVGLQIIGTPEGETELLKIANSYDLVSGLSKVESPLLI